MVDPNNISELYENPNFSSEFGIAIYGKIPQENGYSSLKLLIR